MSVRNTNETIKYQKNLRVPKTLTKQSNRGEILEHARYYRNNQITKQSRVHEILTKQSNNGEILECARY